MHRPWVSIIMPCYNYGAFISEAIESVRSQTFDDWELLVVDDGSTDDSLDRATSYDDHRIHVDQQQNAGVSVARNRALDRSTGRYVAFLDADDRYLPTRVQSVFDILNARPKLDFLISNFVRFVHPSGERLSSQFELVPEWRSLPIQPVLDINVSAYEFTSPAVASLSSLPLALAWIQSVTINGELARSARFPEGVRIGEDSWYMYRILPRAHVGILDEVLVELRRHGNNSFTSPNEAFLPELRMFEGLASEFGPGEARRAFLAAANRSRRVLGYAARQRKDRIAALRWYFEALQAGPSRFQALKGLAAAVIGH